MRLAERLLPNPGKNVPYLDAIRGAAVLMVLVRHAWGLSASPALAIGPISLTPFIAMMSSGVDLFFVLSGMLLSASFLRADVDRRPAPNFREYFTARILRIGPPYWVVLVLVVLLYTPQYIPNHSVWSERGAAIFLAHTFFAQSLFIFSFGVYGVASPFWTLTVEMVFYLTLPLAVRAFYKGRWWQGIVAAVALSLGWLYLCRYHLDGLVTFIGKHAFDQQYPPEGIRFFLSHQILGYLPHFAIGIAISAILQRKDKRGLFGTAAGVVYFVAGLGLVLATMYALGRLNVDLGYADPTRYFAETKWGWVYYFSESIPFAFGYGLIILGASLAPQRLRDGLSSIPMLCLLGVLGYSIYLIHMPLLYTLNMHGLLAADGRPLWHFLKMLLLAVPVITLVSMGLFFAIERPSIIWAGRARKHAAPHPKLSAAEVQG